MSRPRQLDGTQRSLRSRRAVRPTRRGIAALVLGILMFALAYQLGRRELLVASAVALLLPIVALILVRARRPRFEVVRLFSPAVVVAGATAHVQVRVRNVASSASTPLVWNDALPWRENAAPGELASIPAGSVARRTRVVEHELHPPRRGIYPIGPLVVEHEDPFGMATSTVAVGETDKLIVVPAIADLPQGGPSLSDGEGAAQLVQRRVAGNEDDLTTREYRPGDALRRVHWRASARHGDLMVRQEEHRSNPDARIIVDTRLRGYRDAVDDQDGWTPSQFSESFEWVVRMVASLGMHLEANGFTVSIEESSFEQIDGFGERWEGGRRSEGFLTSLAGVRLVDRPGLGVGGGSADPIGPVFAVASEPEESTVDWMLRRRRAGDAAIAFLVDGSEPSRRRLAESGWLVIPVRSWDDPAEAWTAAAGEAGYVRGDH